MISLGTPGGGAGCSTFLYIKNCHFSRSIFFSFCFLLSRLASLFAFVLLWFGLISFCFDLFYIVFGPVCVRLVLFVFFSFCSVLARIVFCFFLCVCELCVWFFTFFNASRTQPETVLSRFFRRFFLNVKTVGPATRHPLHPPFFPAVNPIIRCFWWRSMWSRKTRCYSYSPLVRCRLTSTI